MFTAALYFSLVNIATVATQIQQNPRLIVNTKMKNKNVLKTKAVINVMHD